MNLIGVGLVIDFRILHFQVINHLVNMKEFVLTLLVLFNATVLLVTPVLDASRTSMSVALHPVRTMEHVWTILDDLYASVCEVSCIFKTVFSCCQTITTSSTHIYICLTPFCTAKHM